MRLSLANPSMASNPEKERTFIMIKPDGVQRGLIGEIIKRFEQKGFTLRAMKFLQVREHTSEHTTCSNAQLILH